MILHSHIKSYVWWFEEIYGFSHVDYKPPEQREKNINQSFCSESQLDEPSKCSRSGCGVDCNLSFQIGARDTDSLKRKCYCTFNNLREDITSLRAREWSRYTKESKLEKPSSAQEEIERALMQWMFVVLIITFVYLAASRLFHLTLLDDEHDLYNVTGVKSSELDILCNHFEEDPLMTTLHEPYMRKDCKRGKVREISTRSQILIFLIWIRHYCWTTPSMDICFE